MKTRERILQASLSLFNERGERQISTNHIASYLDISPGNLYYHFRNKVDIVRALFSEHKAQVQRILEMPEGSSFTIADKANLLERLFEVQWAYRFFYRDKEYFFSGDADIAAESKRFFADNIQRTYDLHRVMAASGLIEASDDEQKALSLNAWLVMTSWIGFARAFILPAGHTDLPLPLARHGIYQILAMEKPFMSDRAREELAPIEKRYACSISDYMA